MGIKRHKSHCYIIKSRCYVCMYCFYSVIHFLKYSADNLNYFFLSAGCLMRYFAYILSLLSDRPIFAETWPYRSYLYQSTMTIEIFQIPHPIHTNRGVASARKYEASS
jgi:hypothetical protein